MKRHSVALVGLMAGCSLISGCGVGLMTAVSSGASGVVMDGVALNGSIHGGQQPVAGATIQLYAAGMGGYGAASTPLLTSRVVSGADGGFTFGGSYVCPDAATPVYLVASGGNPGMASGTNNGGLMLMAAIGPCGQVGPSTFINVNELTTVASVWALAPFMATGSRVGTAAGNAQGLTNAFATAGKLVNVASGTVSGPALPAGATVPAAELNSLANVLAACVNSAGGVAGDGTPCGTLFSAATVSGLNAPLNTIEAALSIAKHPGANVQTLYSLVSPKAPFQPSLASKPSDWTVSISYSAVGLKSPKAATVDSNGTVWVANSASNSVTAIQASGVPLPGSPFSGGGLNMPQAIAFDASGNVWIANQANSSVTKLSATGVPAPGSPFTGGGLSQPSGISVDASGNAWVSNAGNSSVTVLAPNGAAMSPAGGFVGGGMSQPVALAVSQH